MSLRILGIAALLLAPLASGGAPEPPSAPVPSALLSFKSIPTGEEGLRVLLNRIFKEAFSSGRWRLMERQRVDALLAERGLQDAGACESGCVSGLGDLLGVRTLLIPEFERVDGVANISLRELDVATGEVLRFAEVETDKPLASSSKQLAQLLIRRLLGDSTVPASDSGYIAIDAIPATDIWIDGNPAGRTPLVATVWPGTHRIATSPGHVLPPTEPDATPPDASATSIVIVEPARTPRHHGHHGAPPPSSHGSPSSGNGDAAAIAVGAAAAIAGVAMVAAATMPDSVWSSSWQDVKVGAADTARVDFRKDANPGKAGFGLLLVATLILGSIAFILATD
jgi:hypothetical protein